MIRRHLMVLVILFLLFSVTATTKLRAQASGDERSAKGHQAVVQANFSTPHLELLTHERFPNVEEFNQAWGWSNGKIYLAFQGTYVGTLIYDVTNPRTIKLLSYIQGAPCTNRDIKTYKNYAYITTDCFLPGGENGLQIVQLDHPRGPQLITTFGKAFSTAHTLFIDTKRGLAFINGSDKLTISEPSTGLRSMRVLDLSDPIRPKDIGGFDERYVHDGFALGNLYYAAEILDGYLDVLDISNPASIRSIGKQKTPQAFTHNVWLSANTNWLFAGDEKPGSPLLVYDLSDKINPRLVRTYRSNTIFRDAIIHNFVVNGNYLYVAWYTEGLRVIDIRTPQQPKEIASYDTYGHASLGAFLGAWGTYVDERGFIYVGDIENGLFIFAFRP